MTKYTDTDVARMLGWRFDGQYYHNGWDVYLERTLPAFALSTPPSPEANANTARYVIPFIEAQGWYFRHEIDDGERVVVVTDRNWIWLGHAVGGCFASTVCRAALQAWEAKKGTNHE